MVTLAVFCNNFNNKDETMKNKSGFTLVEVLIVIGIICILLGLLAPAILKSSETAADKGHIAEMEVLKSALIQYHHDNKGWPIPSSRAQVIAEGGEYGKNSIGEKDPAIIIYSGKDTFKVWNRLTQAGAKGDYNIHKRDYIKVTEVTAIKKFYDEDPERNIEDENIGKPYDLWGDGGGIKGPLVYASTFIECPKCTHWSTSSTHCNNDQCPGRKDDSAYRFKEVDKEQTRRGVMPYKIRFDLSSDTVEVTE